MAPKELTRHQLSGRLQYESRTPAFLHKLKNKIQGGPVEDEDEPQYYDDGSGRPPIPLRPAIPDRPKDDRGSASEDDADELPQVIVLKEGKHLTAREAENERRKGLSVCQLTQFSDSGSVPQRKAFHCSRRATMNPLLNKRTQGNHTKIHRLGKRRKKLVYHFHRRRRNQIQPRGK